MGSLNLWQKQSLSPPMEAWFNEEPRDALQKPQIQMSFVSLRGNTPNKKANMLPFFYSAKMNICSESASLPTTQHNTTHFGKEQVLPLRKPASQRLPIPRAPWWIMNPWLMSQEVNPTGVWKLLCFSVSWIVCPGLFIWITYYFVSKPKPDLRRQLQSNEPR